MVQAERTQDQGVRTPADVSTLLVELGRALKGWAYYPPEHAARAELLDRAWRAFQGDLRRNGPLSLEIRRGAFWLPGAEAPISGRADDTARQLQLRAVRRVVLDGALDRETFAAFFDAVATDPDALAAQGGFEAVFYVGERLGVQVNDVDWHAALERHRAEAAATAPTLDDFLEVDDEDLPVFRGAAQLSGSPAPEAALDAAAAAPEEPEPSAAEASAEQTQPVLPADPAFARAHELEFLLAQLDECEDDAVYREHARQLASLAERMREHEEMDGLFRVLVALAHHAGDDAKRSFAQRETAGGFLAQVAHGPTLAHLIDRAVDAGAESSLEATAALRELGARAAPAVLDRLEVENDPECRGRLTGVIIAMGDEAAPALVEALVQGSKRRMRAAVRLAGETQNPRLVACLREVLLSGESEVARDAAQALVRVGDVTALDALAEALRSLRPDVAALAAFSLGSTGRAIALAPLQDALRHALDGDDVALAREIVRAIGRLGRPEAAAALAAVLDLGGLFRRKKLRDVHLAVVTALGHLPGKEAQATLGRVARGRDARLREAAELALRRGAQDAAAARRNGARS